MDEAQKKVDYEKILEIIQVTNSPSVITSLKPERVQFDKNTRLGSGTYASVYSGTYLGTEVAVKRFRNSDSAALNAYERELEILKSLRINGLHPNLIHMIGAL
jgi:predicted Ser/Thr protein kinase